MSNRANEIRKEIVEISEEYYRLPDESWVLRESMENEVESLIQEYRELHVSSDIVSNGGNCMEKKRLVMVYPEVIGKIMYGIFEDSEVEEILDENIIGDGQMYWCTPALKQGIEEISKEALEEALEDFKEYLENRTGLAEFEVIPGIITGWKVFTRKIEVEDTRKVEVEEFDIDQYIECSVPTRF